MQISTFQIEVTPPLGHPLCAGWYGLAVGISDPLYAGGVILAPDGELPIVLCSIEWCEMSNRTHLRWRQSLADAAGTTPERVTVHCMHPHCAPWPDEYAQTLIETQRGTLPIMDVAWCAQILERLAAAARAAARQTVTHLEIGRAKVENIASNRRILGDDGKIKAVRYTTTRDAAIRAEPAGTIDPHLKTVSFWDGKRKLAALHYYAVHPTSYEDGRVTPDFTGLARARRQSEDEGVPHFYFTECAGDITAGKYNDGARENRELFTRRIHAAMIEAESASKEIAPDDAQWKSTAIRLPPRPDMNEDELRATLRDASQSVAERSRAALKLAYLERGAIPIEIAALHFGRELSLLHLPGEAFIEYQLFAHNLRPDALVAVAAYGDCGPGYICREQSFAQGGYEPIDSFVAPRSEQILKDAITQVMKDEP